MGRLDRPLGSNSKFHQLRQYNEALQAFASISNVRAGLLGSMGYQYQGERDLYTAFGYLKTPDFDTWMAQFTREDLASTVVRAPVDETWRESPQLIEDETPETETPFEAAWATLEKKHKVSHFLRRLDLISGIGRYGVLFMGFSDVTVPADLAGPVVSSATMKLLFLTPLTESNAMISSWVTDPGNERFGMPETYTLSIHTPKTMMAGEGTQGRRAPLRDNPNATSGGADATFTVHWSRVLHVAEGLLENNVFGTPRLEVVLNRLMDLQKTTGGAAETFFRAGHPGLHVDARTDVDGTSLLGDTELASLKDQIGDYIHNFERVIRTQGVDVKQLAPAIASPKDTYNIILSCISGATGIPKRVLIGSEQGKLAADQDASAWMRRIESRREQYVSPMIVEGLVDRLIQVGVLPEAEYTVKWPELMSASPEEKAEVAVKLTTALANYANSPGASVVVPEALFMELFLQMDIADIKRAEAIVGQLTAEERAAILGSEEPDEFKDEDDAAEEAA